jgi:small subunit ribosomal protein S20
MAHTKQALKRARQSERLRNKNKAMRSDVKTQLKALRAAIAAKDEKAISTQVRLTQSKLDKAAKRRVLHPNAAARAKARISRAVARGAGGKK